MFTRGFASYSVDDVPAARQFYGETLGLAIAENMGGLSYELNGLRVFVYPKEAAHQPATYTVVNFEVADIAATVDELTGRGVTFLRYDNMPVPQDERGILRGGPMEMGPDIAWFEDPAGNILSLIQSDEG